MKLIAFTLKSNCAELDRMAEHGPIKPIGHGDDEANEEAQDDDGHPIAHISEKWIFALVIPAPESTQRQKEVADRHRPSFTDQIELILQVRARVWRECVSVQTGSP